MSDKLIDELRLMRQSPLFSADKNPRWFTAICEAIAALTRSQLLLETANKHCEILAAQKNTAIAALSAKPEPECAAPVIIASGCQQFVQCVNSTGSWCANCGKGKWDHPQAKPEPAKPYSAQHMQMSYQMPDERVEEWIDEKSWRRDSINDPSALFIKADDVRTFLTTLTAEHEAQLARLKAIDDALDHQLVVNLESTLDSYASPKEALNRLLGWTAHVALDPAVSKEAADMIAAVQSQAEAKGRREALAGLPVDALESAYNGLRYEWNTCKGLGDNVDDLAQQTEQIKALIESARAAQEK